MKIERHGISIGVERVGNELFLSLKLIGKLTHQDYETIGPFIESALNGLDDPVVNVFVDGSELEGWELRAVWDDFRLGLKHGKDFKKVALFSHTAWHHFAAKVAAWFTTGEVRHFTDSDEALRWLQ